MYFRHVLYATNTVDFVYAPTDNQNIICTLMPLPYKKIIYGSPLLSSLSFTIPSLCLFSPFLQKKMSTSEGSMVSFWTECGRGDWKSIIHVYQGHLWLVLHLARVVHFKSPLQIEYLKAMVLYWRRSKLSTLFFQCHGDKVSIIQKNSYTRV